MPERLAKLLDDPRPAVQRQAIASLAARGEKSLAALEGTLSGESSLAMRNAIWATCRIDHPDARRIAGRALSAGDPLVRDVAGQAASLWRDPAGVGLLVRSQASNRRLAAEVAGRCGSIDDARALLAMLAALPEEQQDDRVLRHAMVYALMEIAHREPALLDELAKAKFTHPRQITAVLTVFDQTKSDKLPPEPVFAALDSQDQELQETAFWIVTHHPEWETELAETYGQRLRKDPSKHLAKELSRLAGLPPIQTLLAKTLVYPQSSAAQREVAAQAMSESNLPNVPQQWLDAVAEVIKTGDTKESLAAVRLAGRLRREKQHSERLDRELIRLIQDPARPADLRLGALAASHAPSLEPTPDLFDILLARLAEPPSTETTPGDRPRAAEIVARATLSKSQLIELASAMRSAGPLEVDSFLKAFQQSTDDEVGLAVVAALQDSKLKVSLPVGMLRERLKKFGPKVQDAAERLYAEIDAASVGQKEKLETLLATIQRGDVRRGQQVFHSAKAACSQCHAIGYAGGTVGPDLTKIGLIRTERDLVESVAFPSNSFVQGYEPAVIITTDGKTHSGLLRRTSPEAWTVITAANQSVQLSPSDVEETQLGKVSIMPAGLDQQLTPQQLADLIAYLKACR